MKNEERALVSIIGSRSEAKKRIDSQISRLNEILEEHHRVSNSKEFFRFFNDFKGWYDYTKELLKRIFSNDSISQEFVSHDEPKVRKRATAREKYNIVIEVARINYSTLCSIFERMRLYPEIQVDTMAKTRLSAINLLGQIANRFHIFTSQLGKRQRRREPFQISDEYDLQDVLLSLLRLFFDDVRREEYTPSYAGKSSKIDFLIKSHQIVMESKMTRQSLQGNEVADELIIDIERYQKHPDCQTLFCLVYDPKHLIENPTALESDLSRKEKDIDVRVIVTPKTT